MGFVAGENDIKVPLLVVSQVYQIKEQPSIVLRKLGKGQKNLCMVDRGEASVFYPSLSAGLLPDSDALKAPFYKSSELQPFDKKIMILIVHRQYWKYEL